MSYVLFDIGGTNTRVAVSEDLKSFGDSIKFKTPKDFDAGIDAIVEAVGKLTDSDVQAMAGGIRGVLVEDKTATSGDEILSGWNEQPLVETLKKKLKTEVYLENDAAVVGLGEALYGAGKGHDICVYHTVSTGVGGAKIEHGELDDARYGFEPGMQILDVDRSILGEDVVPTLESLVSGSAVEARVGMKAYEIPQEDKIWDELAGYLAHGLRNTIMYWSPDIIVLGGSMILGDPRILLDDITRHTEIVLDDEVPMPEIVDAALGDSGGLYGAMAILNTRV